MEIWVASTARNTRSGVSHSFSCQLEIYGLVPKRMSVWATPSIAFRLKPAAVALHRAQHKCDRVALRLLPILGLTDPSQEQVAR